MKLILLKSILTVLPYVIRRAAARSGQVREHLAGESCAVTIRLRDDRVHRTITFRRGRVVAAAARGEPTVTITFSDVGTALALLRPEPDQAEVVDAVKNFKMVVDGPDRLVVWFSRLMGLITTSKWRHGTAMPDGTTRYTTNTSGGPVFVHVQDGRIVRTTPIELDRNDAESWSIEARGKRFTPLRRATVSPHALGLKSMVYSDKRLLHPMKRVDFDPNGERNIQNRGISGYERIGWDEAFDIVANEIKRMKAQYGPGAITIFHPAHHQWGNVGYWLSALYRFGNLIGFTRMAFTPVSWEGWYWGAMHHFGGSVRLGLPASYSTVEDCLREAEMIVFWSSDPESTGGIYGGAEGTQRRLWAKELGLRFVHIDPHFNKTAQLLGGKWIPIRPGTDPALAIAIMHEWIVEGLYDERYVAERTDGFDQWRDYVLGVGDGQPKTPEWQEAETGIPAKDVRSLARLWGRKKTYLAAGGLGAGWGGACRAATGEQWTRCMIMMMAMQGWGKPGVNFGNLQMGTPVDLSVYFPGYSEGGISGDLQYTAASVNNYCRMPHVLTMNPVRQAIPHNRLYEAITQGSCEAFPWDGSSPEAQLAPYRYPAPGYSPVHMLYRYGGSSFSTIPQSSRLVETYRHPSLEFVVNQSVWNENEVRFADVILPACTSLERWDIGEWANSGGYIHHAQYQLNHRFLVMQHKCIEPLGESKSDYDIFAGILERLGMSALFTEGCDELAWCKRVFDSSDLPKFVDWETFLRKGYHVLPAPPEQARDPVDFRWFADGGRKDVPEPHPLPSQYVGEFGKGLPTQSGKLEFAPHSLRRDSGAAPKRSPLARYEPAWEGRHTEHAARHPLQLISNHPPYSFHTYGDGKGSIINNIKDHRVEIDGYRYWILRLNDEDAAERGIRDGSLVRVFNDRGSVICAAVVGPLVARGVAKSYESSAELDFVKTPHGMVDRGGCINLLTPSRAMAEGIEGVAPNSCMVEVEIWDGVWEAAA